VGVMGDAGLEITNGLGAFLCVARSRRGFGRAFCLQEVSQNRGRRLLAFQAKTLRDNLILAQHGMGCCSLPQCSMAPERGSVSPGW